MKLLKVSVYFVGCLLFAPTFSQEKGTYADMLDCTSALLRYCSNNTVPPLITGGPTHLGAHSKERFAIIPSQHEKEEGIFIYTEKTSYFVPLSALGKRPLDNNEYETDYRGSLDDGEMGYVFTTEPNSDFFFLDQDPWFLTSSTQPRGALLISDESLKSAKKRLLLTSKKNVVNEEIRKLFLQHLNEKIQTATKFLPELEEKTAQVRKISLEMKGEKNFNKLRMLRKEKVLRVKTGVPNALGVTSASNPRLNCIENFQKVEMACSFDPILNGSLEALKDAIKGTQIPPHKVVLQPNQHQIISK